MQVTRNEFRGMIENAIDALPDGHALNTTALRAVGRTTSAVAVGAYHRAPGCPVKQAHPARSSHFYGLRGAVEFATAFDKQFPCSVYDVTVLDA